jgi:O-antigen/teichoic acid export membrane protein
MVNKVKNVSAYIGFEIVNKMIPFAVLPIVTKYLTPQDYGLIASFNSYVAFLSIFIGLSVHGLIGVEFFKISKKRFSIFVANGIFLLLYSSFFVFVLQLFFLKLIQEYFHITQIFILFSVCLVFFRYITLLNLTIFISEEKSLSYGKYQFAQSVFSVTLILLFVVYFKYGYEGYISALLLNEISFGVVSLFFLRHRGFLRFKKRNIYIKKYLHFGIPLILHQMSGWLKSGADKLLLISLVGASAAGLFQLGYQISSIMIITVTAIHKVWNPYIYKKLSLGLSENDKVKIVKGSYLYFVLLILFTIVLYLLGKYAIIYFIDGSYLQSVQYIFLIVMAFAFNGMYFMVISYIFYFKKTKILAKITFATSIVHVGLSFVLIKSFGAIGSAYAMSLSYFITFVSVWYYSNKVYPLPWLKVFG